MLLGQWWWRRTKTIFATRARLRPKHQVHDGKKNPPSAAVGVVHAPNSVHEVRDDKRIGNNGAHAADGLAQNELSPYYEEEPEPKISAVRTCFVNEVVAKTILDGTDNGHV